MKTSKYFFVGFILFLFCFVIYLFNGFLLTIAIGILLAVSTANINRFFLKLTNDKNLLSATSTTLVLALFFLVPFMYAVIELAKYASNFDMKNTSIVLNYIQNFNFHLPEKFASFEPKIKEFIASININSLVKQGATYLSTIGKSSAKFIVDMGLIIAFYFFANLYGKSLMNFLKETLPVEASHIDSISHEVANTMSVVLYSTIATAVLQGFLFGVFLSFYGYDGFLMGILYAFASLVPIVGGALIFVPISIYELANGNTLNAIIIFLYSIIMIATIADNFIKPLIIRFINSKLVSSPANINELLIFFAMLAGLSTFGFWGIILGPAIVTLFIASLNSYRIMTKEFDNLK